MSVYCNFLMDILKISSLQTELSNSKNHGQVTILKKHTEIGKSQYTRNSHRKVLNFPAVFPDY